MEIPTLALDRCVAAARETGCPPDQVENFLKAGYIPLPWQWRFHAAARDCDMDGGPVEIAAGGARGPGKTHASFAQVTLDDCQRQPGLKFLYLRSLQKAARESFADLVKSVLKFTPHKYKESDLSLHFPNGSRGVLGGYATERDIQKYIGIEYDLIVVEERTMLRRQSMIEVNGSLRTSKSGWRPRTYSTTNPGNIGHGEFKEDFVIPFRKKNETKTRFIPATYKENPHLNKEYIDYLEGLVGDLGKMWRDGDWDVFAGMAFPLWRYERHAVAPFEIPDHWVRLRGVDWGYAAPFGCLWGAINPDNHRAVLYREAYQKELTDRQQARHIKSLTPPAENIRISYADPSLWAKKNLAGIVSSAAEEYAVEGVILSKGDNDRLSGKRKVDRLLADLPDGRPGLLVFDNLTNFIQTFPNLARDSKNPEDVDTEQDDHLYDCLKYLLTGYRDHRPKKEKSANPWLGMKGL